MPIGSDVIDMSKANQRVLPGDKLATIEEFSSGSGTSVVGESVISTSTGIQEADMANRVVRVKSAKSARTQMPNVGDYITGLVDSSSPTMAQITIKAINEIESSKEFSAMLSLRDERRRSSSPIKAADLVRAKVISTKNSIFHLALTDEKCGVISTVCSSCGGPIVPLGRDRVKCPECGLVDDRLLAEDFFKKSDSNQP